MFVSACVCMYMWLFFFVFRWPLGTPWGIKRDFLSLGVLGRMVGWWLQSFLKLSTLSHTWDLTWDWTSAWQICPDQWETSECLIMVSLKRVSFFFFSLRSLLPSVPALFLSLSGDKGKGGISILSPITNCIVTLCLCFSLYKSHPSLGGITSRNIKRETLFF